MSDMGQDWATQLPTREEEEAMSDLERIVAWRLEAGRNMSKAAEAALAAAKRADDEFVFSRIDPVAVSGVSGDGLRYDDGKVRMDLLDAYALEQLAAVLTFGATKYAPENWRRGLAYSRIIGPAMRHLSAIMRGEDFDAETGLPHAAHLMCNAMFLVWMQAHRADLDDRWRPG